MSTLDPRIPHLDDRILWGSGISGTCSLPLLCLTPTLPYLYPTSTLPPTYSASAPTSTYFWTVDGNSVLPLSGPSPQDAVRRPLADARLQRPRASSRANALSPLHPRACSWADLYRFLPISRTFLGDFDHNNDDDYYEFYYYYYYYHYHYHWYY